MIEQAEVRSTRTQRLLGYLALALLSYVPALRTLPGKVAADTKQYLYLDPGRVMDHAWSMWDPNIGLGTVTHQNIGYLFPMGPFFWTTHALGLPMWVAQRLWLGSIIFFAGLGVLYLMRTLDMRGSGAVIAALAFMLSPYVLDYAARISAILLPWAGLPWLLAFTIRGLREGRWRYAALFALVVQVVGSVNATALVFVGIAPVMWVVYATFVAREIDWKRSLATVTKIGVLTIGASLWWMAGLWAQGSYGLDVLKYTETLKAVSRTTLPNEVLRGLGYWFFYGTDKLGPWIEASTYYTQNKLVISISYAIPILALLGAGLVRWRHRAFFIVLTFVGVIVAVGSHPYDTPTPVGAVFKHLALTNTAAFALRSTGRAAPLVILGIAVLLGTGVNAAVTWLDAHRARVPFKIPGIAVALVVGVLVIGNLNALWNGTYYGKNLDRPENVPQYWLDVAHALDTGEQSRALEVPGIDFASYRWGNTVDPITPGLMDRPYVARELIPYGSPASANLLNAFDLRLQDRQLPPNAISPVSRLMSVGDIVTRNDIQYERYRVLRPTFLWELFTPTPEGLQDPQSFGPTIDQDSAPYPFHDEQYLEAGGTTVNPPSVAIFGVDAPTPLVRAAPSSDPLLIAGDGDGVVDASTLGLLRGDPLLLYSGSFADNAAALRRQVARGATLVVTDTNRERARRWSTVTDTVGYTTGPGDRPLVADPSDSQLDMFPGAGENAYTTTRLVGAKSVGATSYGNPISYTPEDRAANAFDGNPDTAWRTGAFSEVKGERIQIRTTRPITTDHVNLLQPTGNRYIKDARLTFDLGHALDVTLDKPGKGIAGQTITFPRRTFQTFQVQILHADRENLVSYGGVDPVGFREIRLVDRASDNRPVRVSEIVKMPTDLLQTAGTSSLAEPLMFVMTRDRVIPVPPRKDPERNMVRQFSLPTARSFTVGAQSRLSTLANDTEIDRALGYDGPLFATSSQRLPGAPADRASAALDHNPATSWTTPYKTVVGQSVTLRSPTAISLSHLDLRLVADPNHSVPTQLEVRSDSGATRTVDIPKVASSSSANATVLAPVSFPVVSGATFRFTIKQIAAKTTREWYCGCDLTMPAGIAELGVPGLASMAPPAELPATCRSDLVSIDGRPVPARLVGTTAAAAALDPIGMVPCTGSGKVQVALASGTHILRTQTGAPSFSVDRLVLGSAAGGSPMSGIDAQGDVGANAVAKRADVASVHVTSAQRDKVQATITPTSTPFWLVLGQSSNAGWRATVDGHDLGASTTADGYGNGWLVQPSKSGKPVQVSIEWVPQRTVNRAIALSIVFVLTCLLIMLVGFVLRRRSAGWQLATSEPSVFSFRVDALVPSSSGARTALAVLIALAVGAVTVAPWVGFVLAAAIFVVMRWPRTRVALRLFPAAALALCALFIVYQEWRRQYPSQFEWPTYFGKIRTLGWASILFLFGDALVELFHWRPDDDRGT